MGKFNKTSAFVKATWFTMENIQASLKFLCNLRKFTKFMHLAKFALFLSILVCNFFELSLATCIKEKKIEQKFPDKQN